MTQFAVPARPAVTSLTIDRFLGCNFTDHPTAVAASMSPWAPNMVRDVPGKVRKSMGWETVKTLPGRINGAHGIDGIEMLIHAGTSLYGEDGRVVYEGMADEKSRSFLLDGRLYLLDGTHLTVWDGAAAAPASANAKVPTLTIAKAPSGGGTPYEDLNLLQPKFTELFSGTETDRTFQLSFSGLDEAPVTAKKLTANGSWAALAEQTDFTVDRAAGTVTFVSAPGKSPITGEDNLSITAARTVPGYAARIESCTVGILYGVGGSPNRLFAGGGEMAGRDFYSAENDGGYFADTAYCVPAAAGSRVVGYSVVKDALAAHLTGGENDRNIALREGTLSGGKALFAMTGSLQGPAAIAPGSFAQLAGEPVFLTAQGVFAVTPDDVTGERYAQNRSYYLNGRLLKEAALAAAQAVSYHDYYLLCTGGAGYLLDGLQPLPAEKSQPYSTRQYAGFYRTNLPARTVWTNGGRLFFGTEEGNVCRFFDDDSAATSYADDGEAICARWETPEFSGSRFFAAKSFRTVAARLAAAPVTSVQIFASKAGVFRRVFEDDAHARYFDWANLSWPRFVWSADTGPRLVKAKIRVKRVDRARLALENKEKNEPFGLYELALTWREGFGAQ